MPDFRRFHKEAAYIFCIFSQLLFSIFYKFLQVYHFLLIFLIKCR